MILSLREKIEKKKIAGGYFILRVIILAKRDAKLILRSLDYREWSAFRSNDHCAEPGTIGY